MKLITVLILLGKSLVTYTKKLDTYISSELSCKRFKKISQFGDLTIKVSA